MAEKVIAENPPARFPWRRTGLYIVLLLLVGAAVPLLWCGYTRHSAMRTLLDQGGTLQFSFVVREPATSIKQRIYYALGRQTFSTTLGLWCSVEMVEIPGKGLLDVSILSEFPEMQTFAIGPPDGDLREVDWTVLARLPKLREISFRDTSSTDAALCGFPKDVQIRSLSLSATDVTAEGLRCIRFADQIEELEFTASFGFDDEALAELERFPNLRVLKLIDCISIQGAGFEYLQTLDRLEELEFNVADNELARSLALKIPNLMRLNNENVTP